MERNIHHLLTPPLHFGVACPPRVKIQIEILVIEGLITEVSALEYIVWNSGQPDNKGGEENCVKVIVKSD